MDKTILVRKIVTQMYELTYTKFCEMDDVKNLTDEQKQKSWENLIKNSKINVKTNIITIDDIEEEVEWDDIKEDFENCEEVTDAIEE